ncbi:hypothetical protein KDW19_22380 [Burkholderia cenocepacia]|uniref:hypothetical protein n=1 Tax=Burkholderia cepacia complex TaxID=87882 RepID=UPI001B93EA74|nr:MULTISPECIES: hypothetical protein [Burkholderia cepacia complex]ELW9449269.1 hypothetical protein [Burkholderia cenocepacia]MBR8485209.1 hypothetical protein [Burkholderia cenocepacia]MDN7470296.1 hypothetical protein [Burkholderia orbicola]MDN7506557.1 hypothetical protein [Burkholderia orbicola]
MQALSPETLGEKMKPLNAFLAVALTLTSALASAQTAADFQDQVASQIIGNVCNNEMKNVGIFAGSRAKGKTRDEMLVAIDEAVTSQHQTPAMAQLHQVMLNIAYSGPIVKSDHDPQLRVLMAKAHLTCVQYMNSVANGLQ